MSDFKNVMKGGWHPKGKDGTSKESWRGDFKGINQVAGWVGKGKGASDTKAASTHISRPLATLKDPALFGPPPKNVNYHGGAALPNEITPVRTGLGAPLSHEEIEAGKRYTQQAATAAHADELGEEDGHKAAPPLPYRIDSTGLHTSHLPPPPVHTAIAHRLPEQEQSSQPAKPKPGLPPRLPSRQNSSGAATPASGSAVAAPPAYDTVVSQPRQSTQSGPANGLLNSSAINRLGNAGVSVPAFGIGKSSTPTRATSTSTAPSTDPARSAAAQPASSVGATSAFSELSNRFARMNSTPQTASQQATSPQAEASSNSVPTLQQSQRTLRTATNFHKDPSSISVADAKEAAQTTTSAARTANAFREKHADTFAAAGRRANAFDQKYKVKSRFESFLDKHAPLEDSAAAQDQQQQQQQQQQHLHQQPSPPIQPSASPEMTASISRKPPPPPPPKKPTGLAGSGAGTGVAAAAAAPPVPISTKPTF